MAENFVLRFITSLMIPFSAGDAIAQRGIGDEFDEFWILLISENHMSLNWRVTEQFPIDTSFVDPV